MDKLPISVIIAAKNAEKTIEECLSSVQRDNPAEIIVVDGNSTDSTVDIARRYTEKVYSDEGGGESYAHQLGAEQATQEYIAYVDADIVLAEGTLAILLAELRESDYISMQAKVLAASLSTYWGRAADWSFRLFQAHRGMGLSAAVLRRDTIMKYKFEPPRPFVKTGGEDYEFQMKVEKDGYKLGTSSAFVYHHHRTDLKTFVTQWFRYGQDAVRFIRKYGPWNVRFWPPLTRLYWIAVCLIKGKPNYIPYFIVGCIAEMAGMIKGFFDELIGEALRRRQKGAAR